jgi:protease stability complex PrcB-like protein
MNSRSWLLVPLTALAACAGGNTLQVSPDQADGGGGTAVSLAPTPSSVPDSSVTPAPVTSPSQSSIEDSALAEQGYAPYGEVQSTGSLEIRRIGQWSHTGVREARRMVIQDANAWAEFWSELGVGNRPAVDFTRDVVIAVAAGERPSGGHEIAVSKVTQENGELTAEIVETVPGPNCLTTSALVQPVDVVVVQGVKPKNWSFVERREVRGCQS